LTKLFSARSPYPRRCQNRFGNITLIKGGDKPNTIDLKHSDIVSVVDLARIYALVFLGKPRIAHQARQTAQGQAPGNFLALDELSNFERSQLKDAFGVVQTLQEVLSGRYSGGWF
jgi:CBS domain-containing protein